MKITSQEEYGLRCLLRLAEVGEARSLTIPEIAAAEGLSSPYVAKLLAVLRQAGLIDSVRGRSGGYRLARPPVDITLGQVLSVLGEPLFDDPGYCLRHAGTETDGNCVHHGNCNLKDLWNSLEQWMRRALAQITLADVLHQGPSLGERIRSRLAEAVQEEPAAPLITLTTIDRN
jgi:Rrf2 family protein